MKKTIILLSATLFFFQCRQDEKLENINPETYANSKSEGFDDDFISERSKQIESNRRSYNFFKKLNNSQITGKSTVLKSDEIVVTNLARVFSGAVYDPKSVEELEYRPFSYPVEPITISYSFPSNFISDRIEKPSLSAMQKSVFTAMNSSGFSGQQSLSFDYSLKKFTKYSQLRIAFGANINIGKVFNLGISSDSENVKKNTAIFAKFSQKNFTVDMDLPSDGNIFLNNSDLDLIKAQNPIYVSSITYGRLGVLFIESNESYESVNFALKAAFNAGVVNGGLNIDVNSKKILEEADIKAFVAGGKGSEAVKVIKGFNAFSEFIANGGEFTKDVPGVPIYFTATKAIDNSVFYANYSID